MRNLGRIIQSCKQRLIWQKRSASLFCGRPLSSRSKSSPPLSSKSTTEAAATRKSCWASSSQPCLVLPPDYAHGGEVKDDTDDEKENDRCYYSYYSLEEKKVVRVKDDNDDDRDNSSSRKRILLPWERDMLLAKDAICVGSSHGWVAYLNPRQDCSLYLFKHPPLSSPDFVTSGMFRLPPLQTHPHISAVCTSSKRPAAHPADRPPPHSPPVTRDYFCWDSEHFDDDIGDFITRQHARSPYYIAECFLQKLVLSWAPSPSPSPSITPVVDTTGSIALALVSHFKLAFCRLGDPEWTPLKASAHYSDLIYSTKYRCFLGLHYDNISHWLDCIDFSDDPSSPQIYILRPSGADTRNGLEGHDIYDLEHLVESSGEILMVKGIIGHHSLPDQIHVYKLDYVKQTWEPVKRIGDHALFVGPNHSFSLSTLHFPHLKPNSIYFIDPSTRRRRMREDRCYDPMDARTFRRHKIGVFSMEDNTFEQPYTLDDKFIYPIYPLPLWVAPCINN